MPRLKIFVERKNKNLEMEAESINEILKKLKLNPETVIISRNDELVLDDVSLNENDDIKFLSVISGG